jgi:hypothetical protein
MVPDRHSRLALRGGRRQSMWVNVQRRSVRRASSRDSGQFCPRLRVDEPNCKAASDRCVIWQGQSSDEAATETVIVDHGVQR